MTNLVLNYVSMDYYLIEKFIFLAKERCESTGKLAHYIKKYFVDNNPLKDVDGLYKDIINCVLDEVNWMEIAQYYWDEAGKE